MNRLKGLKKNKNRITTNQIRENPNRIPQTKIPLVIDIAAISKEQRKTRMLNPKSKKIAPVVVIEGINRQKFDYEIRVSGGSDFKP